MTTLTSDPGQTRQRFDRLHDYMDANVLCGNDFICRHQEACRFSALYDRYGARKPDRQFSGGQLSHVGRHYDLAENGVPLRTLVIGMDDGSQARTSLEGRRAQLEYSSGVAYHKRNFHMKGTTSALRVVVGRAPGEDAAGEWLEVDQNRVHLFDAYAMVNARLSSVTTAGGTKQSATHTMTRNCFEHLRATVKILEPRLCIAQGGDARKALLRLASDHEPVSAHLRWGTLPGGRALLALFSHPSARPVDGLQWGTLGASYLCDVVVPTLRESRQLLLTS